MHAYGTARVLEFAAATKQALLIPDCHPQARLIGTGGRITAKVQNRYGAGPRCSRGGGKELAGQDKASVCAFCAPRTSTFRPVPILPPNAHVVNHAPVEPSGLFLPASRRSCTPRPSGAQWPATRRAQAAAFPPERTGPLCVGRPARTPPGSGRPCTGTWFCPCCSRSYARPCSRISHNSSSFV